MDMSSVSSQRALDPKVYADMVEGYGYCPPKDHTVTDWNGMIVTTKTSQGVKYDKDKLRYDLIPPEALDELAKVLTFGAAKYADRNWEKGMNWGRVFGAAMRHMWAWWRGEAKDPETNYSHLSHAITCIAFLLTYEKRKVGTDDRNT
jgi:Domain of unknown function (DUF5664)